MSRLAFQRAREPEQKEQRRRELLDAAARLLGDGGLEAVTLSARTLEPEAAVPPPKETKGTKASKETKAKG